MEILNKELMYNTDYIKEEIEFLIFESGEEYCFKESCPYSL